MIMTFLSYQRSAQDELVTERKPTESEVAIKMHIRYPSYLLQQGDPSNIVLKKRLRPSNLPTTSWYTQKMLFNKKNIGIACPISILFHPVSPSIWWCLPVSPFPGWPSHDLGLFTLAGWSGLGSGNQPKSRWFWEDSLDCHEIHFEKSLTPGLPTFLGIAGCHTKIRHLSLEKHHKKLLLGSAQQIGWEWWTVRVMTFCSN